MYPASPLTSTLIGSIPRKTASEISICAIAGVV
jgi:hypothetical protein